jgi:ubiquinone/menaquinone biosynthesis C-methylase UbiE
MGKNILKNLFFWRAYTTNQNKEYWKKKGDVQYWVDYQKTWSHLHRDVIASFLNRIRWFSLMEMGCGSAPNIIKLVKTFPGRQMAGIDINQTAIDVAKSAFKSGALFRVGSGEDVMMSDKCCDVVLTDMYLIYVGPNKIGKYIKEIKRLARDYVVLHEFHERSWLERWKLRILSGRHAYNYIKVLEKQGFYDVQTYRMPKFEEDNEQRFRHLIVARVPKH